MRRRSVVTGAQQAHLLADTGPRRVCQTRPGRDPVGGHEEMLATMSRSAPEREHHEFTYSRIRV